VPSCPFAKSSNESFSCRLLKFNDICESWKYQSIEWIGFEFPTTIASFLKCLSRLLYLQFFAFYSMPQSSHVNKSIPRYLYSWVISIESLYRSNAFWFKFLLLRPNIMTLGLYRLTSRLEELQKSYSLFKSLYRHALNLESRTTSLALKEIGNLCFK
jgi:hypothetical protein